jgi:multidrug efflux pump subunit AcrA (membrane-fusion protein)
MSNTDFNYDQGGTEIEVNVDPGAIIDANEDPGREVKPPPGTSEPDLITRRTQQHELAGLSDMKRQVEDLTRQKEDSDKRARDADARLQETQRRAAQEVTKNRQEAANSRTASFDAQKQSLDTAIQATDAALDAAEAELAAAYDRGDNIAVAKGNRKLAELTATRVENQRRKEQVEADAAREQKVEAASTEDVGGGPGESAFDKYIKQFNPRIQEWMRKHPIVVIDKEKNALAFAAHAAAERDGIELESDAYFNFINRRLGFTSADNGDRRQSFRDVREDTRQDPRNMSQQQQRQPPRTSAPVSREGGIDGGRGSVRVRLTKGEIEHATNGITHVWGRGHPREGEAIGVEEMARRKAIMHAQGRYMNSDYQGG